MVPCEAASVTSADTAASWVPVRTRIDDGRRGVGYEFEGFHTAQVAMRLDEVAPLIEAAEREAQRGRWVVSMVSYDAAPAFEPAMHVPARQPLTPLAWFASFAQRSQVSFVDAPDGDPPLDRLHRRHGGEWFRAGVEQVRELIERGDVYQVNLTDRLCGHLVGSVDDLYRSMAVAQGGAFNALIEFEGLAVVSASPELFVRVEGTTVFTRPMKGTRPRHGHPGHDRCLAAELATSPKDRAENVMIVDLLRNDLSRVSSPGGVDVPELFTVERYETVWQMTSTVRARLRDDVRLTDLFRAAFPCGSVTGAPKIAAMTAIAALEPSPRGLYCGTIGVIEPTAPGRRADCTWSVAIRTAVVNTRSGEVEYGSGGGITYDSDPVAEDAELEVKTAVVRTVRRPFALFETVRLDDQGVHHVDRHLRRLAGSAEYFGYVFDDHAVRAAVSEALGAAPGDAAGDAAGDAVGGRVSERGALQGLHRVRITLHRQGAVEVEVLPVEAAHEPVRLALSTMTMRSDDPFVHHKTTCREHYELARRQFSAESSAESGPGIEPGIEIDDVVLANERGEVTETTIANLLYRLGDRWYTPPTHCGLLPGVGRGLLIERGEVHERVLPLAELAACAELAVVSALRGRRSAILAR